MVQPDRPQMTVRPMRIACWIPKDTNWLSEYVILTALPLQQWLHELALMLRYSTLPVLYFLMPGRYLWIFIVTGDLCDVCTVLKYSFGKYLLICWLVYLPLIYTYQFVCWLTPWKRALPKQLSAPSTLPEVPDMYTETSHCRVRKSPTLDAVLNKKYRADTLTSHSFTIFVTSFQPRKWYLG